MSRVIPSSSFACFSYCMACPACNQVPLLATLEKPTDWFGIFHCSNDQCGLNPPYFICRFCSTNVLPGNRVITKRRDLYRHGKSKHHLETMSNFTLNISPPAPSAPSTACAQTQQTLKLPADNQHPSTFMTSPDSNIAFNRNLDDKAALDMEDDDNSVIPLLGSLADLENDDQPNPLLESLAGIENNDQPTLMDGFMATGNIDADALVENSLDHKQRNENNFVELFKPMSNRTSFKPKTKKVTEQANINHQYFERQHQHSVGPASLMALAMYDTRDLASSVHPTSTLWGIMMTWLLSNLPKRKRDVLAVLLRYATTFSPPSGYKDLNIPQSPSQCNNMFISGANSILKNLPYPRVHELSDGHVYVPLVDIVRDLMAHGRHVESLSGESNSIHSQSPRGREILAASMLAHNIHPTYILPIYLWRDGFDPFNVKKNKASAWCMFASIGTPQSTIHSTCNTYLSALGPSAASHQQVEELLCQDLCTLTSGELKVYDGASKTVVTVYAQLYSIQEDRPEKGSHTYTAAGNSSYHARFGYAGNIHAIKDRLPSCSRCLLSRLHNNPPTQCTECYDWAFDELRYPAPKDYPRPSPNILVDGTLPFRKITFESLQSAAEECHQRLISGSWNITQAKCFLATEGFSSNLSSRLIQNATKCKRFYQKRNLAFARVAAMPQPLTNENTALRDETYAMYSDVQCTAHQRLSSPPSWNYPGTGIHEWVETIMHQLFLGVTKSMFTEFVNMWLRSNRKFASFVSDANPRLKKVGDLCLDYCKAEMLTLGGGFGRYVSENYLAYARLCKWVYGNVSGMQQLDVQYKDPEKRVDQFTSQEAKGWLKARNIPFACNETKSRLLALIQHVIDQNPTGQWPPLYISDSLSAPLILVEDLIAYFVAMISRIMVRGHMNEMHAAAADRHIKLFLSKFNDFESYRQSGQNRIHSSGTSNTPGWLSKYNFITLLNLPSCMLRYGSLRALFEGDGKGEGALPALKEVISTFRGNWAMNATTKYYHHRSIREVLSTLLSDLHQSPDAEAEEIRRMSEVAHQIIGDLRPASSPSMPQPNNSMKNNIGNGQFKFRYKAYQTYQSIDQLLAHLNNGNPVSLVISQVGYFAIIKDNRMVQLIHSTNCQMVACQAAYFSWTLKNEHECSKIPENFFADLVLSYGILLPWSSPDTPSTRCFYLITSDWEELSTVGSLSQPLSPSASY